MGTINYGTNKYITMGLNVNDFEDIPEIEKEYEMECLYIETSELLAKYTFNYWNVSIQPGYYDGFYIEISNDWLYFDDAHDRNDALKETTQLKLFLLDCLSCGIVAVYPGWCTGYANGEETKTEIRTAIKAMKNDIKQKPTWYQYRNGRK